MKQRIGVKKGNADREARKAYEQGVRHKETGGSLRRYLNALYLAKGCANGMRVHNYYVYIFAGRTLVTVLALPKEHWRAYERAKERKN